MTEIARMNEEQLKEARKLIKQRCCNYDQGRCLILDWEFCDVCAQWLTHSVLCRWFREAVLPANQSLELALFPVKEGVRRCAVCHKRFIPASPRSKYCSQCAILQKREKTRRRVARYRARM